MNALGCAFVGFERDQIPIQHEFLYCCRIPIHLPRSVRCLFLWSVARRIVSRQMLADRPDRLLDPPGKTRIIKVYHHQTINSPSNGYVQQACFICRICVRERHVLQIRDDNQTKLQVFAGVHADSFDRVHTVVEFAAILAGAPGNEEDASVLQDFFNLDALRPMSVDNGHVYQRTPSTLLVAKAFDETVPFLPWRYTVQELRKEIVSTGALWRNYRDIVFLSCSR